jgi:dimethylamine/trimethylamine dehydrogenase
MCLKDLKMLESRYGVLFEPVKIGPVTARNRFYQVPHCNGGGYRDPSANAEMRRVKAEGGWAVIFTEQVEIHPTSDITPYIELRIWDDKDVPVLAKITDAIHSGGALAGIELTHNCLNSPNSWSREVPMAPSHLPVQTFSPEPMQARAMDKEDIRNMRRWHREACIRAKRAGFDIVQVYGAHGLGVIQHFLSRRTNQRTDEYGGSLKNRARMLAELIGEAKDAVGDSCGVAIRIALDEMAGPDGFTNDELRDVVAMHGELPDLWDFAHGSWNYCSGTSRFHEEGSHEKLITGLKQLTSKPVVGVGRFTSADMMVRQVRQGVLDFVGAARPSIADPFLPNKIRDDRFDDIRECIGCNICASGDMTQALSRCTQNSAFMEEWRKGWHPERIKAKTSAGKVLVVGAGPAGLSAAHKLGMRGYEVAVAEATAEVGGRVSLESRLPGLSAWARVRDYRMGQIGKMPSVSIYRESRLGADDVMAYGFEHICVATGASWRRDGVSRYALLPVPVETAVFTPDDIMAGRLPSGHVVIYDDDHYYMGNVIAELLIQKGCRVTYVSPSSIIAQWTHNTLEQEFIQARVLEMGAAFVPSRGLIRIQRGSVTTACVYTGREQILACDAVVLVTSRLPNDQLYIDLKARQEEWKDSGIASVRVIGDAQAPAAIAWATYAGHRYAEELDEPISDIIKREVVIPS